MTKSLRGNSKKAGWVKVKVLRLKIYQPHAHYGVPYTFTIKHTYPIPPYSTVIGLMCNVLGVKSAGEKPEEYIIDDLFIDFKSFADGLYVAICGNFETITRDLVWFRKLNVEKGKGKIDRFVDLVPRHPGKQIPVKVDVLEDVRLLIYVAHEREDVVERLKEVFKNPKNRNHHLHLGRSEDWIVYDGDPEESIVVLGEDKIRVCELVGRCDFYTWLPDYRVRNGGGKSNHEQKEFEKVGFPHLSGDVVKKLKESYVHFFEEVKGSLHNVGSFYRLVGKGKVKVRDFEYVPVKLFEGGSFPLGVRGPYRALTDVEMRVPLFFAKMKYPSE